MLAGQRRILPDSAAVAQAAAEQMASAAQRAMAGRGVFDMALSGGNTPRQLYKLLASEPERIDWRRCRIWFTDERCVDPGHPDSNFGMVHKLLLSRVPIDPAGVYRMRGEAPPPEAARQYEDLLRRHLPGRGFDLAILGMGPDGHTASLFPHTEALKENSRWCVANHVPLLGAWRLTLTAPCLNRSERCLMLVTGEPKAPTVKEVFSVDEPQRWPAQLLDPGRTLWLVDKAAASELRDAEPRG